MTVTLLFFSLLRDRAGTARLELPGVEEDATAGSLLAAAARDRPALRALLQEAPELVLTSVNRKHKGLEEPVQNGDEVAYFPPVSGGNGAGHGLLLLSGGFDSPVAAHFALEQGHRLDAVHFSMEPFTDDASRRKSEQLARILGVDTLRIVPIGPQLAEFTKHCNIRHYFVLQKRLMVRLAQTLADRLGATFLVTGENLGQVSSQTLVNLGAIDKVATLPILRPLLGFDKVDIIDIARRIGTYEASKGPEVCDVLGPRHPSTAVSLEKVEEDETHVDIPGLVASALKGTVTIELGRAAARTPA